MTDYSAERSVGTSLGDVHLRLIATSDLHANLLPFDYCADRGVSDFGLAHAARLIAAARRGAANSLLFDNGDFLQGSPLGDYLAGMPRRRGPHPVIEAFNQLGYDAGTLGNHEFNFGLPYLMDCLKQARFPFVCANLVLALGADPTDDTPLVPPYRLLRRTLVDMGGTPRPVTIGVVGFAPPQTVQWDRQNLEGTIHARDILAAARAWVPAVRAAGADVVVALSHSGIGPMTGTEGMEDASTALAALPGVDAVFCGHSHLSFPGPEFAHAPGVDPDLGRLAGKPATMPGHSGKHIGVIDLFLRPESRGWQVQRHVATLFPQGTPPRFLAEDRQAATLVRGVARSAHRATMRWSRRVVGQAEVPLSTFFALAADSAALRLVAQAQRSHVARVLAGGPHAALPLLSAVSPFRAGGRNGPQNYTNIPRGPLAFRHMADLYAFPNEIRALRVTGADLHAWLERAAGLFLTVAPGARDAPLIDPHFPIFNFDLIDGLTYQIDVTAPPRFDGPQDQTGGSGRSRIVDLRFDGAPLDPQAEFVVATNSYRANGSGGFAGCSRGNLVLDQPLLVRDILLAHVREQGSVAPRSGAGWRLAPCPGTTVLIDLAPQAADHADLVPDLRIEPLDLLPNGFRAFRLHL